DGDGVCDNVDNCPNNFNPDQADSDGDGIGNTCDPIADCNSKVLVRWDMVNCLSFSSDGSNRDFSEFNPSFPNSGSCANITASRLSNEEGGHSCVAGASGSTAGICIEGEGGSSFRADDDDALRFSITVNPGNGKIGRLTELSFFQLSPFDFEHLSGNNGRNNYLRKFGVRILKNGNEVFRVTNKNTNQNDWELETFALTGSDFEYTNTTRFDFEILGYQPIRSGNPRFFDVDDIKIKGCCVNTWSAPAQEMAQFDAYKADRTVQLDWVTNTEYKNSHFVVERSSDGINFEDIEELASENNGSRMIRYEAVDTAPMLGDNYYRLKKVHHDLSFEYLPIRKVHFAIDVNEFAVFPNPARDALNVNLKDFVGQAASIQIFNSLGVLMSEKQFTQLEQEIEQFDVSKFHSGVYTISVQIADRKRISRLFIIAKP
ncbi:MAG: T9SS type A sorting domain-containing protein, partial [Bacteroidota bacterium]